MAFTTMAAFSAAVTALSITGIKHAYAYPPATINAADCPLSFPNIPELGEEVMALDGSTGLAAGRLELIVLVRDASISMNQTVYADTLALIDAINTTLTANTITLGLDRWTIRQEENQAGVGTFWALVVTLEASG